MNRIITLGMALALAASLTAPAEAKSKKQEAAAQRVVASPQYQRALAQRNVATVQRKAVQRTPQYQQALKQRNTPLAYRQAVQRTPAYQRALLAQKNPTAYRQAVQRTPQYQNSLTYNKAVQRTPAYQRALLAQRDPQAYREAVQRTPQYQAALAAQRYGSSYDGGRSYGSSYYGDTYGQPPHSTCRNWDTDRVHYWNDRPWHWSGGSWIVRQAYAPAYTASVVIDRGGSSRSLVADVQSALADAGYDPGPVDGVPGSMTRDAIAAYQADNGLAVTGRIDTSLVRSLGL